MYMCNIHIHTHTFMRKNRKNQTANTTIKRSHKDTRMLYRPQREIEGRSPSRSRQTCMRAPRSVACVVHFPETRQHTHKNTLTLSRRHAHARTRNTQQGTGKQTGVAYSAIRLCRSCQVSVAEHFAMIRERCGRSTPILCMRISH